MTGRVLTAEEREFLDDAALAALSGLCANSIPGIHHRPEERADEAYRQAYAMLAARERGGEQQL